MKYFQYWVNETVDIQIDGHDQSIQVLSGSNVSKEDALAKATEQGQLIEERIRVRGRREEYEAPIKEHVDEVIDEANVITVCRYGARILNTCQYTILDLDHYAFDFLDLFRSVRRLPWKERIVVKFLQRLEKYPALGNDFRIYETAKGIRVIGKQYLDPRDRKNQSLLRRFAVDWLFLLLSAKQNCYRARLTPKPYRMKAPTIRLRNPLACETKAYRAWAEEYEEISSGYRVVKLIKTVGTDFGRDRIVQLHDQICNASTDNTLA